MSTAEWLSGQRLASGASAAHALAQVAASLQHRDARNSGAAAVEVAAFFCALLGAGATSAAAATAGGAAAPLSVGDALRHVASIEAVLRRTAGFDFAAMNVAPRLARVIVEEAGKVAAAGGAPHSPLARAAVTAAAAAAPPAAAAAAVAGAPVSGAASLTPAPPPTSRAQALTDARAACTAALAAWQSQEAAAPAAAAAAAAAESTTASPLLSAVPFASIRDGVLDALNELRDELELSPATIAAAAAPELFAHADVVLVAGYDIAVRDCLLAAAKLRRLGEVLVCEGAAGGALQPSGAAAAASPVLPGHALAMELTSRSKPLSVTLIPDAAAAAVMPRVSKVLLGARGVAADGAVLVDAPAHLLALAAGLAAAGQPAIPVIVVVNALAFLPAAVAPDGASLLRLTAGQGGADPLAVLPPRVLAAAEAAYAAAAGGSAADDDAPPAVLVLAADVEVLPPSAVRVIVTNMGSVAPAQAGRLLDELYGASGDA